MQKYFRLFSFLLSAVVIYGNTGAQEKTELPKDVTTWGGSELFSQPVKVFLLDGFDSDDLIEIPIAGYLSGLNKSVKGTRVKIDLPKKVIQIEIGVTEFEIPKHLLPLPEGLIPRALVATIQTPLPRGDYKVFLGNHEEGILKIQESANRNVDSELFAPIETVIVEGDQLRLEGSITSDFSIDQNIENQVQDKGLIWILMPKLVKTEPYGTAKNLKFLTAPIEFPQGIKDQIKMKKSPILIHVRTHRFSVLDNRYIPIGLNRIIFPKD